jgi:hypothetical protein
VKVGVVVFVKLSLVVPLVPAPIVSLEVDMSMLEGVTDEVSTVMASDVE